MCRYHISRYKPHYACFSCRKTFKRRLMWDIARTNESQAEARCPECAELMADMGLDFAAPPKKDLKQWDLLKSMYSVGITFHSCGCYGPGYIPKSKEALLKHFTERLENYKQTLRHIQKHRALYDEKAQPHWHERITQVEQHLEILRKTNSMNYK